MKLKKFFWKNLVALWIIFILSFLFIFIFTSQQYRKTEIKNQVNELTELALAVAVELKPYDQLIESNRQQMLATQARISRVRITLIDFSGKVIFDTEREAEKLESHRYRPEIDQALRGELGWSIRYSDTLGKRMLYVAVPLKKDSEIIGVCRVSRFLELAVLPYQKVRNHLLSGMILFISLILVICFFLLKSLWQPLEDLATLLARVDEGKPALMIRKSLLNNLNPLVEYLNHLVSKSQEVSELLTQEREIWQKLIEASEEGWLLLDQAGRVIMTNERVKKLFPEVREGEQFYWQAIRCPELNQILESSYKSAGPIAGELEKEGRIFSCSASWLPLNQRYLIRLCDITEVKELGQIKKEFVANVVHELKTPLTAIKGFLETLEEEILSQEGQSYMAIIKRNTERLIRLVEDLSRLSELEEKGPELQKEEVDLVEIINSAAKVYQKQAQEKGLYIKIEAGTLPPILADPIQMEQLVVNLIDNALRYTEKGGLSIKAEKKDEGISLIFKDTGIGIPEEHLPRIFERFYVVDRSRSRKTGGTGLGLAIVKHIVLAHGGKIEVSSAPGVGTTFSLWLPLSRKNSQ